MTAPRPEIILGPPGTGKTTHLLELVDGELGRGVAPSRIGYVTFTRRGAEEAINRACEKFGLSSKDLPYFRTLHSLCFRQLGLRRGDVLEGTKLKEFARYAGVEINGKWSDDGTLTGFGVGDRILFMENVARVREVPLRAAYDADCDNLPWREVERVIKALELFKQSKGLMDYTDMLMEFVRTGLRVDLEVLFVDEAQDLSALQWSVVRQLALGARRLIVAGDDDQAIYRWAGADSDHLVDMEGDVRVLGQSWRVPPAIQKVANRVIGNVRKRRNKAWEPRQDSAGAVARASRFHEVDCGEGEVLVLARNAYVIREQVEPELQRQGIVYEINGHSSISMSILEAITSWETLRKGEAISVEAARAVYEHMSSGKGVRRGFKQLPDIEDGTMLGMGDLRERGGLLVDTIWHEALDRLPQKDMSYILAARRRGERLTQRPRVRVSTIHGSKGGQADHVVLLREMAKRTHREMINGGEEDEARVWYVGATRARERLTLVDSTTAQECPWL